MISPPRALKEIAKAGQQEVTTQDVREPFHVVLRRQVAHGLLAVASRMRNALVGLGRRERVVAVPQPAKAPPPTATATATKTSAEAPAPKARMTRRQLAILSFGLLVALPTILSFLYLALAATPQYRSETRFVVRGNLETVSGLNIPMAGAGVQPVANTQEARVIVTYLQSRAMVDAMQRQLNLRKLFDVSAKDPIFSLAPGANEEDLLDYWNRHVHVDLETISGVITVEVDAFSPTSAAMLAAAILQQVEEVTNELSIRNRGDRVLQAEAEERAAFTDLAVIRSKVEGFRNAEGMVEPTNNAADAFSLISRLRDQRSELNTKINTARAQLDENSPVVTALKERLTSIDGQIAILDKRLLGDGSTPSGSSENLKANAELEARRRLAEQRLRDAELELQQARSEQAKKQVYILTFMPPTAPTEKFFPSPTGQTGLIFVFLFACWGIMSLYVSSVYARTR